MNNTTKKDFLMDLKIKSEKELKENRRKAISNMEKETNDIEPFENKDYLNYVSAICKELKDK